MGSVPVTLAAGAPDWVVELGGVAGELQDQLASSGAVGGVHLRPSLPTPTHLAVTVARYTGGANDAAWWVASSLAGLWPPWLEGYGVGLEVAGSGWRFRADCDLMGEVATGMIGRPGWLLRAVSLG